MKTSLAIRERATMARNKGFVRFVLVITAAVLVMQLTMSTRVQDLPSSTTRNSWSVVPTRTANLPRDETADFFVPTLSTSNPKSYWPVIPLDHYQNLSRTFLPWSYGTYSWCGNITEYDKKTTPAGLMHIKLQKAASSTMSGITLRIAHAVGMATTKEGGAAAAAPCASQVSHTSARLLHSRDRTRSFMFSTVRDPTERILSYLFYISSNRNLSMSDNDVIHRLETENDLFWTHDKEAKWDSGYQVGYLHTGPAPDHVLWNISTPDRVVYLPIIQSRVHDILKQYDFLLVVERLNESLVALQLLLDLDPSDILYVSGTKQSGSWAAVRDKCHKLIPKTVSPVVRAYLESPTWLARNYGDYLLYHAANQSLDATIEKLGRVRFHEALTTYQSLLAVAQKTCQSEAVFPCSPEGQFQSEKSAQSCYDRDWGCGYPCLDEHYPRRQKRPMMRN